MLKRIFFVFTILLCGYAIYAQPGGGGPCPEGPPCAPPVPITGVEYLLASGLFLGARYIFKKQK